MEDEIIFLLVKAIQELKVENDLMKNCILNSNSLLEIQDCVWEFNEN